MAGLGLSDAVSGFIGARNDAMRYELAQRDLQRARDIDAVNAETAQMVKEAQAQDLAKQRSDWANSAADPNAEGPAFEPKPFVTPDDLMFKVAETRGKKLLERGLIDEAMANESQVQAQRLRMRQTALERFMATGRTDWNGLATGILNTVPGAPKVVATKFVKGSNGSVEGPEITPSTPDQIEYTMSDGTTHKATPEEVLNVATRLADPQYAAHEAAMNLERLKASLKFAGEAGVQEVKNRGLVARTEAEGQVKKDVQTQKDVAAGERADKRNKTLVAVGGGHDAATVGAANARAAATRDAATISGAAKVRSSEIAAGAKGQNGLKGDLANAKGLYDLAKQTIGEKSQGMLGGTRIGGEDVSQIASMAEAAIAQMAAQGKRLAPLDAVNGAIETYKKGHRMPGETVQQFDKRRQQAPAAPAASRPSAAPAKGLATASAGGEDDEEDDDGE